MSRKQDVTEKYIMLKGRKTEELKYDEGYDKDRHVNEIKSAEWLKENFGGTIILLTEQPHHYEIKRADYLWDNKLWELKNTTSAKTVDSVLRKAIHQIMDNPGGVILDFGKNPIQLNSIESAIDTRIKKSCRFSMDIMIIAGGELKKVTRYTK